MIDKTIPLCDLHRHLDGSVRLATILEVGLQHNFALPGITLETLRPFVQVSDPQPGVMAFIQKFEWQTAILVNTDTCQRIAFESVVDAAAEGLSYVELRFSPLFMAEAHGLDPSAVTAAVIEGVEEGRQHTGIMVKLIGILSRTYGPQKAWLELNALLQHRLAITGIDLAGDEANFPGSLFVDHFRQARDAGWQVTIHAGEIAGPESIWQAVQKLGASRIGHGLSAIEDPALLEYLFKHQVGIECNLTSNVQTSIVSDYAHHPLRKFLEMGQLATINTDDPGISAITIQHEFEVAAPQAGITPMLARQAQQNALKVAFLTESEKQSLVKKNPGKQGL